MCVLFEWLPLVLQCDNTVFSLLFLVLQGVQSVNTTSGSGFRLFNFHDPVTGSRPVLIIR